VRRALSAVGLIVLLVLVGGFSSPASAVAATSCDGLTPGSYVPGPTTTGVRAGSVLTRVDPAGGQLNITTAGTVIENQDIYGRVVVKAANVVIRNSIVRGLPTAPTGASALIVAWDTPVSNLLVEGVTLKPQFPSLQWGGISGHDYTARCVDSSETTDGFGVFNSGESAATMTKPTNVKITQSWCHALAGWSPAPDADNKSHTDCLQAQGAQTMTVSFNNFDSRLSSTVGTLATNGYAGCPTCAPVIPADPNYLTHHPQALSDIMVNKLTAAGVTKLPGNWNVYGNRFAGADVPINAGDDRIAGAQLGRLCDNIFAGDAAIAGQAVWVDPNVTLNTCDGTPEANTFMTPIPVKRNA
jgi:hypothetical protein